MDKQSSTPSGITYSILLNLTLILACLLTSWVWQSNYSKEASQFDAGDYSKNEIFGVRVSKFADLREASGTKTSMNGYSDFLANATAIIGEHENSPIWLAKQLGSDWFETNGLQKKSTSITAVSNEKYAFGIQKTTVFKIYQLVSFPTSVIGKWVHLVDEQGKVVVAVITAGRDDQVEVSGDIPPLFFPTKILLIPENKYVGQSQTLISTQNFATVLRGGIVSGFNGAVVHVYKPGWVARLKYRPAPGDKIEFSDGNSRVIKEVLEVGGGFILQLNGDDLTPYFFNQEDIVKIISGADHYPRHTEIAINTVSDEEYHRGKGRFLNIATDDTIELSSIKDKIISADDKRKLFVVADSGEKFLSLDLKKSERLRYCLDLGKQTLTIDLNLTLEKSVDISDEVFYSHRRDSSVEILKCLEKPYPNKANLSEGDVDDRSITSASVWFRSFDFGIVYGVDPSQSDNQDSTNGKIDNAPSIWEIYPGSALNIFYKTKNPAPVDLLIHVLSEEQRETYYEKFVSEKADYFAFSKPRQFTPWLVNWHWPLFREVLYSYQEAYSNIDFSLWVRNKIPEQSASTQVKNFSAFPFDIDQDGSRCDYSLHEVTVKYDVKNALQKVPVIGKSDRYLIHLENIGEGLPPPPPVSLPPEGGEFSFPVFARADAEPLLNFRKVGLIDALSSITFEQITVKKLDLPEDRIKSLFLEGKAFERIADWEC